MGQNSFKIKEDFYLNGEKFKLISGGLHYFRVVPEYWKDRLLKLKALGCNTVETYIPWNMHEPRKGEFHFDGMLNVKGFIELAQELGLWVIIRPSPYICGEWEFGGLPFWLLAEEGMRLRAFYRPFLNHVRDYYGELFKILRPLQIQSGGPVILMQIENEYGYYGDDENYLLAIRQLMIDNGAVVDLVTSDGPWAEALTCGKINGILPTSNFGTKADSRFPLLKQFANSGPLMCMEFWIGWFDHWGVKEHQTGDLEENINNLNEILKVGHVNIYMFHGGTNFGFMNGSNYYEELTPDVTSYDYDALLTEAGDITPKYKALQEVIAKYIEIPQVELLEEVKKIDYGVLKMKDRVGLFEALDTISQPVMQVFPHSMECLGQGYGYTLYRSQLKKNTKVETIQLIAANDRANIFIGGQKAAILYDRELLEEAEINIEIDTGSNVDILVENMGRVNFGYKIEKQRKGIDGCILVNKRQHYNWDHFCLTLDNLEKLDFSRGYQEGMPGFYRFEFMAEEIGDTYLDFEGWGKGCAFVNGFNIGRFWEIGPQKRLYIPGPLLKLGANDIIIFETDGRIQEYITLKREPDLG